MKRAVGVLRSSMHVGVDSLRFTVGVVLRAAFQDENVGNVLFREQLF